MHKQRAQETAASTPDEHRLLAPLADLRLKLGAWDSGGAASGNPGGSGVARIGRRRSGLGRHFQSNDANVG